MGVQMLSNSRDHMFKAMMLTLAQYMSGSKCSIASDKAHDLGGSFGSQASPHGHGTDPYPYRRIGMVQL